MTEIEGVRQWLEQSAEFLRGQLQWFGGQLVPGAVPHVVIPKHPSQVDWSDPPRHRFEALANLSGPPDPTRADHAARVLHTAGWTVQVQRDPQTPTVVTVRGDREGYRLQARLEDGFGGIVLLGETPNIQLYQPDPSPGVVPAVTADTISDGAVLCYECDGAGSCPTCRGRGWTKAPTATGRQRCRTCLGSRVCPVCGGAGELRIAELSDEDRIHYPHIP
ncbi:hypothetical protein ACFVMC_02000 [Nocardia sp. NPDC127579]|uniref:hypothetical protein n=1 Tax=Nocardia sp. NPDC127579 TaxID=3345402 RepID=UPI0036272924